MGSRAQLAAVLGALPSGIFTVLLFTFLLFLLRLLLRKEWLAGAAFVAIITFAITSPNSTPWIDYPIQAVAFAVFTFAILRFGLLAAIVFLDHNPGGRGGLRGLTLDSAFQRALAMGNGRPNGLAMVNLRAILSGAARFTMRFGSVGDAIEFSYRIAREII